MANKNQDRLSELDKAPVGRLLLKYSAPAVVGMMVMSIYNVIDRMFIGQGVGPDAIAGLAITFPIMNISAAFGVLIGGGASARTSILLGSGDKRGAEMVLGNSLVMTLIFGTLYIATFALLLDPILRLFGASESSLPYAHDFMVFILPGLLMNNLCFSFNNVMRASGYPTKAMITMFIGAGLNVILDPIFIFVCQWGIKGAAAASTISMAISAAFVMAHFFNKRNELHFTPGTYRLRKSVLLPIMAVGAAPCIINTAGSVINGVINNTVYAYGGDMSVAAIGIFTAFTQLLITFVVGVCMGMQPIIGYNYGAHRYDRLRGAFWLSSAVCTVACVLGTLAGQFCPTAISRIFTSDPALIEASNRSLRLITIMFWSVGYQIVATNLFQSLGRAGKSIFMSLSRQVIFLIPLLFTLPHLWQLNGVWLSFPISDTCSTIVAIVLVAIEMRAIRRLEATMPSKAATA